MYSKNKIVLFFCLPVFCFPGLIMNPTFAQYTSCSTTLGNDSIVIKYMAEGKEEVISAPHKIPITCFPVPDASAAKKARNAADILDINSLNIHLLDSLVWAECNIYRKEKGLQAVAWNDTIYSAAIHHSEYQVYYNRLGHGETDTLPGRDKEQKQYNIMRVFNAEICMFRSYREGESTYKEMAGLIIDDWKHSPGHNAVMIAPQYRLNAFASALRYDIKSFITRENMEKYNPALLQRIETAIPDYFRHGGNKNKSFFTIWCTGSFMEKTSVKKEMDWVEHATVVHNKDGTISYTNGNITPRMDNKTTQVKKHKKKR
jgi:uncharacterized protein YkwD